MSDVESSIVSEDNISMATDGSEAYDPRANQHDYGDYGHRGSSYAAGGGRNYKSSPKSNSRSFEGSDADGDDYSADFNDFENASEDGTSSSRIHSQPPKYERENPSPKSILRKPKEDPKQFDEHDRRQDVRKHQMPLSTRDPNRRSSSPRDSKDRGVPSPRRSDDSFSRGGVQVNMPTTAGTTLQAEVVLDEISREVVRLRNQQRMVLKERRQVVADKKDRADRRRKEYEETLARHRKEVADAKQAQEAAEDKSKALENQIKHLQENKDAIRSGVVVLEKEVEHLKGSITELTASLSRAHHQRDEAEKTLQQEKKSWLSEKARLEVEISKNAMMEESIRDRIQSNEARLEEERKKLPAHQERTLKEREKRLEDLERELTDREAALRITEDLKMTQLEQHRKDTMSELSRFRSRVESDLAAERQDVAQLRSNLLSSTNQWELLKAEEQSNLESAKLDLARREGDLGERRQEMDKAKALFEGQVRMMQPTISAAEKDRDDARALKEQADRVMLAAEEHASSILKAERGLLKREQACSAAEAQLQEERNKLTVDKRIYAADTAKQRMMKQALEAERFRLHQLSLELSQQANQVKRGALIISQAESNAGAVTTLLDSSGHKDSIPDPDAPSLSADADPGAEPSHNSNLGAVVSYVERSMASSTSLASKNFNQRLSKVSPSMQGVSVALENLLLNTSEPNAELEVLGNIGDGYRNYHADETFLRSGTNLGEYRISPQPEASTVPPPPPDSRNSSALQLLESRVHPGASKPVSDMSTSTSTSDRDKEIDLSSLHKAVQSVGTATEQLGAIATKYGVYSR